MTRLLPLTVALLFAGAGQAAPAPQVASTLFADPSTTPSASLSRSLEPSGPSATSSLTCYPFQDPDAGPAPPGCLCDGLYGIFPYLSSSTGQSSFNPCGFTTTPTAVFATAAPFINTESNGDVVFCASSTYYNYAVNTNPICAGATSVVFIVPSIASLYSKSTASFASVASVSAASVSSAISSASYVSAAAVPSAGCRDLGDDVFGETLFEVYGINGWAGSDGGRLLAEEWGCGFVSFFDFHTDTQDEFEGHLRDTQYALFFLSLFKAGCVERAVHSAGGPSPGTGPGKVQCYHTPERRDTLSDAFSGIGTARLEAVKAVVDGKSANNSLSTNNEEKAVLDTSSSSPAAAGGPQPGASLGASASAALSHLLAAQRRPSTAPTATPSS